MDRHYNLDEEGMGVSLRDALQFGIPNTPAPMYTVNELMSCRIKHSPHFYQIRSVFTKFVVPAEEKISVYEASSTDNETDEEDLEDDSNKYSQEGMRVQATSIASQTGESENQVAVGGNKHKDFHKKSLYVSYEVDLDSGGIPSIIKRFPHDYYSTKEFLDIKATLKTKIIVSLQNFPYFSVDKEKTKKAKEMMLKDSRRKDDASHRIYYIGHFVLFLYSEKVKMFLIFDTLGTEKNILLEKEYKNQAIIWLKVLGLGTNFKKSSIKVVNLGFQEEEEMGLECAGLVVRILDVIVTEYDKRLNATPNAVVAIDWIEDHVKRFARMNWMEMRKFRERGCITILRTIKDFNMLLDTPTKTSKNVSAVYKI